MTVNTIGHLLECVCEEDLIQVLDVHYGARDISVCRITAAEKNYLGQDMFRINFKERVRDQKRSMFVINPVEPEANEDMGGLVTGTYINLGASGDSETIIETLVTYFGGYYCPNDCADNAGYQKITISAHEKMRNHTMAQRSVKVEA